jgi:hypothetical protein
MKLKSAQPKQLLNFQGFVKKRIKPTNMKTELEVAKEWNDSLDFEKHSKVHHKYLSETQGLNGEENILYIFRKEVIEPFIGNMPNYEKSRMMLMSVENQYEPAFELYSKKVLEKPLTEAMDILIDIGLFAETAKDFNKGSAVWKIAEKFSKWKINFAKSELTKHLTDLSEEDMKEPIQNALYSTGKFQVDECNELANGIIQYIKDAGMTIVKSTNPQ